MVVIHCRKVANLGMINEVLGGGKVMLMASRTYGDFLVLNYKGFDS